MEVPGVPVSRTIGPVREIQRRSVPAKTAQNGSSCRKERVLELGNSSSAWVRQEFQDQADSSNATSAGDEVDDKDDQPHHEKKVNQAATDVEAESQEPQNQNDDKDCPKHGYTFSLGCRRLGGESQAHTTGSMTAISWKQLPAPLHLSPH